MQADPHVLHYKSVLKVVGAAVHSILFAAQAAGVAAVPVP